MPSSRVRPPCCLNCFRWNYRRSSRVVCYLFYKSVMFACPLIFYAYTNGYR